MHRLQANGYHGWDGKSRLAAGHRGDDRNLSARGDQGVKALREPDIFLPDVDVDEPAELPAVVDDPAGDARVGRVQSGDHFAQRAVIGADLRRAARVGPQNGGNSD